MSTVKQVFPYENHQKRLRGYDLYEDLLSGEHYRAFVGEAGGEVSDRYKMLRYITCNFAGLISKVIADLLFGEEVKFQVGKNQDWVDSLYFANKMRTQNYESALMNSARGDAMFKIRVEEGEVIVEDINPDMYFAHGVDVNFRAKPSSEEIAFVETYEDQKYLVKEIYEQGKVFTKVYKLGKTNVIGMEIGIKKYNDISGKSLEAEVDTNIKRSLLVHIPNYRATSSYYGTSDYHDLKSLFYALNNRMSKTDNILDKHSDPILAVPEGVLDENGQVRKEALGMFEVAEDGSKPEYITWNASLDSAFKEIDKIIELLYMFSETSPDVLGLGSGQAESGRALKLRLLRTVAKRKRKQLYYTQALKELVYTAQQLAKANGFTIDGLKCTSDAEEPELIWTDGIADDERELIENEVLKVDGNLTSKKRAVMKIENVDDEEAQKILDEIADEKPAMPAFLQSPIDNEGDDKDEDVKSDDK